MAATVILPWRGGCEHRERARSYVVGRYAAARPDWTIVEAECPPGAWSKSRAVFPALRTAERDAVIVADADVWSDGIESAVRAVTCGATPWAMPHGIVYRLGEHATEAYIRHGSFPSMFERRPYEGVWGGGIVVAHRDTFLDIPLDPRFTGWGGEDESWGFALQILAGHGWRAGSDLIHLWHPPQEKPPGKWGSPANRKLRQRYGRAGRNPKAMRSLIEEAHATFNDDDRHAVHDRPPDGN